MANRQVTWGVLGPASIASPRLVDPNKAHEVKVPAQHRHTHTHTHTHTAHARLVL